MLSEEQLRLVLQVIGVESVEQAIGKFKEMEQAAKDLGESVEGAGEKTAGAGDKLGRAMQVGSSALQLWQGDMEGFVSNLGPLVLALGGSGGLAAVIAGVGQAALIAGPYVRDYYKAWTDGSNEIPKAAELLDVLNDRLKETKSQLDELRTHTFLTNTELQQFNTLTAEQTKLEGQLADQRAAASVGANGSKSQAARSRAVRDAMAEAGGSEALANDLDARTNFSATEARQIIASALRGNESSIDFLRKTLPQFGANYTSPEEAADRKETEELNAHNRKLEAEWRRDMEREKAQEAREAERAKAKADRDLKRRQEREDRELERSVDEIIKDAEANDRRKAAEAKRKAQQDAAEARKAEREADPIWQQRQAEEAIRRQVTEAAQQANSELGLDPGTLSQVIRQAIADLPMTGNVEDALRLAVQQTYMKFQMDMQRQMSAAAQWSETRLPY